MSITSINGTALASLSRIDGVLTSGLLALNGQTIGGSGPTDTPLILTQTLGSLRNNFTGCVGFVFTGATPGATVTALGRWVVSGNSGTHTVYLVDATTTVIKASAVINTSGASAGAFKYASVTPVALTNGTGYILCSDETNAGDQWYDNNSTIDSFTSSIALSVDGGAGYTTVPPSAGNAFFNGASPTSYGLVSLLV